MQLTTFGFMSFAAVSCVMAGYLQVLSEAHIYVGRVPIGEIFYMCNGMIIIYSKQLNTTIHLIIYSQNNLVPTSVYTSLTFILHTSFYGK